MALDNCLRCNNCCTSFGVCITIFDVLRISKDTGKKPEEFVALIDDYQPRERAEPAIKINGELKLLVLKHNETRTCSFFNGKGCSIYDYRPYLCRTYPFILKNGKLADVKNRACIIFWYPKGKERESYIESLENYYKQIDKFKEITEEWNSGAGGSLHDFIKFASKKAESAYQKFI